MHRPGIRHRHPRTTLAATALLSLTLLTACGGSGSGDAEEKSGDGTATATATAKPAAVEEATPLTPAQLETASLTEADLDNYTVAEAPESDVSAAEAAKVTGEDCAPVGRTIAGATLGTADATTHRRFTGGAADASDYLNINTGMVTLASYPSAADAAAALKTLGDAVTACTDGFEWTVGGETLTATGVTADTAPDAGDEAVAFTVISPVEGVDAPWKGLVFRDGATLAHYTLVNAAAVDSGKDAPFPTALITAQADKLRG
ncbi:hypothetical protein AB0O01_06605 [Streptomyces sp. NPDC093252]|uniref:hypothetical protein n=1 Tax=Streptomyces sp. NPDC093252 TaxID=3154980 RepID=UPI003426F7B1